MFLPGPMEFAWVFFLLSLPVLLLVILALRSATQGQAARRPRAPAPSHGDRSTQLQQQRTRYQEERGRILAMVDAQTITPDEADRLLDTLERETTSFTCPFCGGDIRVEAVKCRHCGEFLVEEMRTARRLTRSRDRVLAGVCGGIAEHVGMDPTIVRVLTALLVLCSGIVPGVLVYLVAALIIPAAAAAPSPAVMP
jgi:phage shock protein C